MDRSEKTVRDLLKLADIKVNGKRPFDIQVHDKRVYKKVLSHRELGLGETYMDGWWSVEKLDEMIYRLLAANLREKLSITPVLVKAAIIGTVVNQQKITKAYKNAAAHYNIGNDLYKLMLDKNMVYSCGFWQTAKTLEDSQIAKFDRICKKLYLKPGMKLLDIGCGWGGFSKYAAEKYGVKVTGITPASAQFEIATERTKGLDVKIMQKDYREVEGKFDRIVSIGMLEHVGSKNYKTFFKKCNTLLKDDGIMLHHTIGATSPLDSKDLWTNKYIFPGGHIPTLTQVSKAIEGVFIAEDLENFGPDYDRTLMEWYKNFVKNYPKIKDSYDERFYRMWSYYLLVCAGAFRARKLQLWQIVMTKALPSEAYRGYR